MTEHEKHRRDVHTSFAAAALTGLLSNLELLTEVDKRSQDLPTSVAAAHYSYQCADALMVEWDKLNPAPPADAPVGSDQLTACRNLLWAYHNDLDRRQDGNIAAAHLADRMETLFNTPWVQGATL